MFYGIPGFFLKESVEKFLKHFVKYFLKDPVEGFLKECSGTFSWISMITHGGITGEVYGKFSQDDLVDFY